MCINERHSFLRTVPGPRSDPIMSDSLTLCLVGDVMLGRGVDQILPHPGDPRLHEEYVASAREYVALAERANGEIPKPVAFSYVWGDALAELRRAAPQATIINLETSVTTSREFLPKGINYKMNPENIGCLSAAGVDCCVLANNHILDFGRTGLIETLETLEKAGILTVGAGRDAAAAEAPAVIPATGATRVLVFAFAATSSGVPPGWAAARDRPGVNLLRDLSLRTLETIGSRVRTLRQPGDILVASIHWGGNWGYGIAPAERRFAHALIDNAGFDIVHGHSSHHPKAIEIYRDRPILYGCGDFLNDYEGIPGYEEFRGDLTLMYLPRFDIATGRLHELRLVPFRIRRFRLHRASRQDAAWLRDTLDGESAPFATRVELDEDDSCRVLPR
jgi:poly-gamma-glutamate capsule biosynthesis protein CapA/YwtB (metallophosphatase superfamily)